MICSACGGENIEGARFCNNCASPLSTFQIPAGIGALAASSGQVVATIEDEKKDELIGHTIESRYRIDSLIGLGGMGTVYRATRLLIGDEVAIKILHSEKNDPNAAERFQREAQAAARLKHQNAVTIYDFGVTSAGLQYLVMELVEGESLRQVIKQGGPLRPAIAAEITAQVCAALDEAHQRHIVHRDIKPDNIIINSTTTGLKVKVLDFGIAKLRDDVASHLTQTGSVMGTPHYMSPEQCLGEELDGRADIYSMGIVLYEMLCGRVPFDSPISTAVVVQHVNQPPPSLCTINPSIPPKIEAVVFHALEKRREARPSSASVLSEELTFALTGIEQDTSDTASKGLQFVGATARSEFAQEQTVERWAALNPTSSHSMSKTVQLSSPAVGVPVVIRNTKGQSSIDTIRVPSSRPIRFLRIALPMIAVAMMIGVGVVLWAKSGPKPAATSQNENSLGSSNSSSENSKGITEVAKAGDTLTPSNQVQGTNPRPEPLTIDAVKSLINRWQTSQNSKNFPAYESCYDYSFRGVLRTNEGRVKLYGFDEWMRERRRLINQAGGLNVEVRNMRVNIEGDTATVEFDQFYRSGSYSDWGPKVIKIKRSSDGEKIVNEELKASYRL